MEQKDIAIVGEHEANTLEQIRVCASADAAAHAALSADGHMGYNMPIGGIVAYRGHISPAGVGYDIACGNKAVRLNLRYDDLVQDLPKLADEIWGALEFGIGRKNQKEVDHELFDDPAWQDLPVLKADQAFKANARNQLGTVGSGNHYVDVFKDEKGWIWVGVHFGSRGLGHKLASHFIGLANGGKQQGNMMDAPGLLDVESEAGSDYLQAMNLAGRYAYAGRDWVCAEVASILGGEIVEEVHNHHNFAWKEKHGGEDLFVVRKGATPAFPGQKGFVGGSMGDQSVILEGVETPASAGLLYSTVHGAGRVMSRTQAAGKQKFVKQDGVFKKVRISEGLVDMPSVRKKIASNGTILKGAGADEAPEVYKRLPEVLAHHGKTIKILHRLDPVIVCMAGEDEFDPFKD